MLDNLVVLITIMIPIILITIIADTIEMKLREKKEQKQIEKQEYKKNANNKNKNNVWNVRKIIRKKEFMKIDYSDYETLLEQIDLDKMYFVVDGDYIYDDEEVYFEDVLEVYTGIKDNFQEHLEKLMQETEEYTGRELLLQMFKDLEEHKEYYQTKYTQTLKDEKWKQQWHLK